MRLLTLTAVLLFVAAPAMALQVDNSNATSNAAKFTDPDDNVPFPHVSDNGQPANFQAQPMGNSGLSFGVQPSGNSHDAFQRAMENRQQ